MTFFRTMTVLAAGATLAAAGSASAAKPTYSKDVAPIMNKNCVVCHRPGESAPMANTSASGRRSPSSPSPGSSSGFCGRSRAKSNP